MNCTGLLGGNKLVDNIPSIEDLYGEDYSKQVYISRILQDNILQDNI